MGKSKGRTPKTPKPVKGSGNGGNGKDTVTGLYFDGFGPINSDTTYNQDSSTIKKLLETAGGSLPLDPSKTGLLKLNSATLNISLAPSSDKSPWASS